jgi:ABC-2 type transport system permease protein
MTAVLAIAAAEWGCWQRSNLARGAALLVLALLAATAVLTTLRMQAEHHERTHQQAQAEAAFVSQPDRHPHRMVHYGHYVFRTPVPLALFDPGLDAVTGQSIFLEGHRQNTAMFASSGVSADFGSLSWVDPASIYRLFAPLLLILLGHGALVREREARTLASLLAQGLPARHLLLGKGLALTGAVLLLLVPLAACGAIAVAQGEPVAVVLALLAAYGLYLVLWAALALLASVLFRYRAAALACCASAWIVLTLVLPALAVSATAATAPLVGKLETDLAMLSDMRKLGDGHNADDPAFARLRAELLARHGVQRAEDLPFNLRGVVAEHSERLLTDTLNAYAQRRMQGEQDQADRLARHAWLAPALALADASRAAAGTDLAHHHRFLREAEALRYGFVQSLNQVHARQLAYTDDIRRSSDAQAERNTRVSAANWQVLSRFRFEPDPASARVAAAATPVRLLLLWCAALVVTLGLAGRRLEP